MEETQNIPPQQALSLCVLAGEIMLKNGAETYRVEDTMARLLIACGYKASDCFVASTGIFVGITTEVGESYNIVRKVKSRSTNLEKVALVNAFSRAFVSGAITADDIVEELGRVDTRTPPYSNAFKILVAGAACAGFSFLLDGNLTDCLAGFLIGSFIQLFTMKSKNLSPVLLNMFGGVLIAFLSLLMLNLGISDNLDKVIIGALMPLLPGVAFTNAIRDVLEGDYLSGSARLMDALIVAVAVAAGVGSFLQMWLVIFGQFAV